MNKVNIYNLNDLTSVLNNADSSTNYEDLLSKIRFNFKDIEHLCFWDAENYSKINIGSGNNYELVLICWENCQESQIHNHEVEKAYTYILKGEITEKIYHPINGGGNFNLKGEKLLKPKKISCLVHSPEEHHKLQNTFNGRSVSLHLYVS